MPPPAVVPVLFDEAAITYDLDRLPASARIALQALRKQIQRDGGLSTTRLKRCAAEAADGTLLPHCGLCGYPHNAHYGRWPLMLRGGLRAWWLGGVRCVAAHNQSASRNARRLSGGRYLPGGVPSGAIRAIACSLRAGSACW